ncbi:MAG: class I SAM-dependent methyltransferase [Actinomycetota bacterium]|nr:class I SAM-dependent methyltransferase [Actinomycetota bacterium]
MRPFDDPVYVREQYATENGLEARRSLYGDTTGPDAREVAFGAVAEVAPRKVLEVGCGPGEAAERIARELDADVVAIDQSERMVELARARGVDARVGDAQKLEFADGEFDCVLAAWMLYHVRDVDRALAEMARVLRAGGRLVAVTNATDHLAELWRLVGIERIAHTFGRENGAELLGRHFPLVERRDLDGTVAVHDAEAARTYLASSSRARPLVDRLPELEQPLVARLRVTVFVAESAG